MLFLVLTNALRIWGWFRLLENSFGCDYYSICQHSFSLAGIVFDNGTEWSYLTNLAKRKADSI